MVRLQRTEVLVLRPAGPVAAVEWRWSTVPWRDSTRTKCEPTVVTKATGVGRGDGLLEAQAQGGGITDRRDGKGVWDVDALGFE